MNHNSEDVPQSRIIRELVEGDVSLEQSLKRLQALAFDLGNEELIGWVGNEINGYSEKDDIPEYRRIKSTNYEYSGINGRCSVRQASVPLSWMDLDQLDNISKYVCSEPISFIEQCSKSDTVLRIDKSFLSDMIAINTGNLVACTSIYQLIPQSFFISIYNTVYSRALETLITLEQQFGSLDNIGIDLNKISSKELESVNLEISNLISNMNLQAKLGEPLWQKITFYAIIPIVCVILGAALNRLLN